MAGGTVDIRVAIDPGLFNLAPFDDPDIEALRAKGLTGLTTARKYRHDSNTIRLNGWDDADGVTTLRIQQARYKQQAMSNLILDYHDEDDRTIRRALLAERPGQLPLPTDERLVQSIGVTCIVFYRDDYMRRLTPLLVPRTRAVAVLNQGQWSDSASGAAEWPEDPAATSKTFEAYILDDLYRELHQEIGLKPGDLEQLLPLAMCRELMRAGKPQLFFLGITNLDYLTLTTKMEAARLLAKQDPNEPDELFKMPLFRYPPAVADAASATRDLGQQGIDPQSAASLYYAYRFFSELQKARD